MKILSKDTRVNTLDSIQDVIEVCNKYELLAIDTETRGFYPQLDQLLLLQIGTGEEEFVIDCTTIDIMPLKELLETKTLIMHNAQFDLRFLYHYNIWPRKVIDTFLQEVVIHNSDDKSIRKSLDEVCFRYLGFRLNKEVRGLIHKLGHMNPVVLQYAGDDVKFLHEINIRQTEIYKKEGLERVIDLENNFVRTLAYVAHCGFKIDKEKWIQKLRNDNKLLREKEAQLNEYYYNISGDSYQLDIFGGITSLNWNSEQQVAKAMHKMGVPIMHIDKKTKVLKESVSKDALIKYKDNELVNKYLDFKGAATLVSKYGVNILKEASKFEDGRLRVNFHQIKSTGRMSSGSDDDKQSNSINLQNIPKVPDKKERNRDIYERECFVPNEGNVFVVCDYSQQEQVIMANITKDDNLLNFFRGSDSDMHCYNARLIFTELREMTAEEIKKNHSGLRYLAKSAGFSINYGGGPTTIAANLNIPIEEAEELYRKYLEAFPGLKDYFEKQEKYIMKHHYVIINPISNRKFYFTYLKRDLAIKRSIDWNQYHNDPKYKADCKKLLSKISGCVRNAINYPMQGTGADMMKVAMIRFYDIILNNNMQNIILIPNLIHDEAVIEAPENMKDSTSKILKKCMEEASALFCPIIPVKAQPVIGYSWEH
jgi:DNA polymerase I-like protein with 3'-5' exonuclease and polymerase domains